MTTRRRAAAKAWSALLAIATAAYAAPILAYPFGRDQGLHYYIGRFWLRGLLPYRDSVDSKPPGIYLVHALAVSLFGTQQWGIRALDLATAFALGAVACIALPRTSTRRPGELSSVMALTVVSYVTMFDYWDTAQPEAWEGFFLLSCYAVAMRLRRPSGFVLAGLFGGLAVLVKTPAAIPVAGVAALVLCRSANDGWLRRLGAFAWFALGGATPTVVGVGYFALHRSTWALLDVSRFTVNYAVDWRVPWTRGLAESCSLLTSQLAPALALAGLAAATMVIGRRQKGETPARATLARLAPPCAIGALTALTIPVQGKYFPYHWVVMMPWVALLAARAVARLAAIAPSAPRVFVAAYGACVFVTAPAWPSSRAAGADPAVTYRVVTASFWRYEAGRETRREFLEAFRGLAGYRYLDEEDVGEYVRSIAMPRDTMQVEGFEPVPYAVADLHATTRFPARLVGAHLVHGMDPWMDEREIALREAPPTFVVAFARDQRALAGWRAHGYRAIHAVGDFVVLRDGAADSLRQRASGSASLTPLFALSPTSPQTGPVAASGSP